MQPLSCRDFIEFLDDYLEGEQPDAVRAEFDRHMAKCPYCVDYLNSYRDTVEIARRACRDDEGPPPTDAPEELIQAILAARRERA